eukprot:gene10863-12656_t
MSKNLPLSEIELISEEVEKGLEDSNIIKKFFEKRIQIEEEYAKNLQKLCKSQPNLNKLGGISGSFTIIVGNTDNYATHILQVVQKINDDINEPLRTFLKDLKAEQKTYFIDGQNLSKERKTVFDTLKQAKTNYDSLFKDPESDSSKVAQAEEEYKQQVAIANRYQTSFHTEKFPKIQNDFQRLETIRMQKMKTNLKRFVNESDMIPAKLTQSLKSSEESINAIDTKRDIMAFVNFNKALNNAGPDFVFEPCEKKKKGWRSTMSVLKIGSSSSSSTSGSTPGVYIPLGTKDASSAHPNAVFGVPIPEVMEKQRVRYPHLNVPYVLVLLVNLIKKNGGMQCEGVFRIPGHNNDITTLKKKINEGDYTLAENCNIHTTTSLLKLWLREVPQALIPDHLYDSAVNCENSDDLIAIFRQLPVHNQRIVTYIVSFLRELTHPDNVVHSKMNQDNTAMVFAPSFLRCNNPETLLSNIEREKLFIRILIESCATLQELCPLQLGDLESAIMSGSNRSSFSSNSTTPPDTLSSMPHQPIPSYLAKTDSSLTRLHIISNMAPQPPPHTTLFHL